jgi:hypothetical protein
MSLAQEILEALDAVPDFVSQGKVRVLMSADTFEALAYEVEAPIIGEDLLDVLPGLLPQVEAQRRRAAEQRRLVHELLADGARELGTLWGVPIVRDDTVQRWLISWAEGVPA